MGADTLQVLVVDETPSARSGLRRLGEALGWQVEEASQAEQLRAWLDASAGARRRCVLLGLPSDMENVLTTLAACQAARPRPPVIVLAENQSAEVLLRASSSGVAGFLRKHEISREAIERLVTQTVDASSRPDEADRTSPVAHPLSVMQAVCHDLRNPLSAMMINASILSREEPLSEERRGKVANRILASALRMTRMLEELADYTLAAQGKAIPLRPGDADLHAIAAQAVADGRVAYPGRELMLEPRGELRGYWDSARLRQLLANLLACAVRRGRPGATVVLGCSELAPAAVEIRLDHRGAVDAWELSSAPSEVPFAGAAPDTIDAGLFVARRIVEAHHGRFTTTRSSHGQSFVIHLPKGIPAPPAAAT